MFDGVFEQTLGIAYSHVDSVDFTSPRPTGPPTGFGGERVKLDWQGITKLAATQTLVFGAEHERDEIRSPIAAALSIDSGFTELQSGFGDSFYDTVSLRYDDNDRFGSKVTYRVAPRLSHERHTGTKLKASVGSGFKAPTLEELYESFPAFDFFREPESAPREQHRLRRRLRAGGPGRTTQLRC